MKFTKQDTNILKGVAISLMLCHHLFTFPERLNEVTVISIPFINGMTFAGCIGQFGKICIAMFALLSGYGFYVTYQNNQDCTSIITKRVKNIYTSYWMVFVIAVPVSMILDEARATPFLEDLIYCFLGLRFTYCNEWWFILPIVLLTVTSPLLCQFVDHKNYQFHSCCLLVILTNAFIYYILPNIMALSCLEEFAKSVFWTEIYTTFTLLPAYAMGIILAKYDVFSIARSYFREKSKLFGFIAIIVLVALIYIHPFNWLAYDFINATVFILCILALLELKPIRTVAPIFERLGEISAYMWLTHTLLCYHWCQKLVYAPKYAILIFLWLLLLTYVLSRVLLLMYKRLNSLIK